LPIVLDAVTFEPTRRFVCPVPEAQLRGPSAGIARLELPTADRHKVIPADPSLRSEQGPWIGSGRVNKMCDHEAGEIMPLP
jgi:hypothetical protein